MNVKMCMMPCHKSGNVHRCAPVQNFPHWCAPVQKFLHRCALGFCTVAHRCKMFLHWCVPMRKFLHGCALNSMSKVINVIMCIISFHKLGNVHQCAPTQKYLPWCAPVQNFLHWCALVPIFFCTRAHQCKTFCTGAHRF